VAGYIAFMDCGKVVVRQDLVRACEARKDRGKQRSGQTDHCIKGASTKNNSISSFSRMPAIRYQMRSKYLQKDWQDSSNGHLLVLK